MNNFPANSIITAMARQTLKGKWFKTAVIFFGLLVLKCIMEFLTGKVLPVPYVPAGRGFYAVFEVFISSFIILWMFNMVKFNDNKFDYSSEAVRKFGSFAGTGILSGLIIACGYLLFIIPGIIFQFQYALALFIIADEPAMPVIEALRLSRKMMCGYKWKLFCLNCRFIGWWILAVLTFGIGTLFLIPYQICANIHFYRNVRAAYEAQYGEIQPTEYCGMSNFNSILLAALIFVFNAGLFYCIFLISSAVK